MGRTDGGAAVAVAPSAEVTLALWRDLPAADRDTVRGLTIDARQVEFAGSTDAAIRLCEMGDPATVQGLAIRQDTNIVGFVVLKRGAMLPPWVEPGCAVVSGLRIDARHQGRGLGTAALHALAGWVRTHWPDCARFALRVDDGNAAAIRAYAKAGWIECGERRQGRVGLERTLVLTLRD